MPPVGRKRWNLHDGPQGSLRRLRNQLAEDGCAESQVVLAKQLLEEKCELEADRLSNFKQALDWLICATEQAHPEARLMLRRCIRSSVLDEDSAAIVRAKSCLAASRQEAIARKAARDLFASLSNGEQYITTAQLERRIREICTTKLAKDEEDSDVPDDEATVTRALNGAPALEALPRAAGDAALGAPATPDDTTCEANDDIRNLTVDDVVSAAVYYCHGELPIISDELSLRDPSPKALDRIPFFHRAILHPRLYFHILYLKLLQCLGSFKLHLSIIEFVVIPALYIFTYAYSLSVLATSCIYYLSFGYMVVSTFNMLYTKRQFVDFRMWSGLFLRYSDGNLHADESENLFIKNNIRPYFFFFGALFLNLLIYPTAIPMLPYSEFCVLALILMFATLLNFGEKGCPDFLSLVSFGINVLAKYPYEKDTVVYKGWRFLDLHASNYPSYILCNSIEFSMNARGFLSLLIPVILFFMARKNNWQGFYTKALPHCVTLSWLQMFITFSTGSTRYGFVRSVLALVCAFTCLPFIGVITLTLPFVALFEYVSLSDLAYVASIVLAFFVCLVITYLFLKSDIMRKFVTPFQFILALFCLLYFGQKILILVQEDRLQTVFIELIGEDKTSMKNLLKNEYVTEFDDTNYQITWEEYYTQCHAPSWDINNMAATQIKCSFLEGSTVYWEGYVKDVRLKYFTNSYSFVAMLLPDFLQELYKCYYGDEYSTLCQEVKNAESVKECDFVRDTARKIGKTCHLDKYNKYTTDLVLNMEASGGLLKRRAEISVSFDHHFTNYTQTLRADDKISFKGVLTNDFGYYQIGSKDLYISGYEISCIDCKRAKGTIAWRERKLSDYYRTIANDVVIAGKYVLNFLFNPIIVFK